ncbi:MAG: tetratricopeptide repeat protein, partial [Chitinivibrionales bacterium]|nr:tetratricopeptide repeat protein [Chitinivibrionales bacterium]
PALYERAETYLAKKELPRAEKYYEKALEVNPEHALSELGLARIAKARKDKAAYTKHISKARKLDSGNPKIAAEAEKGWE